MTELEKYKAALEVAQAFICVMRKSVMIQSARREELAMEAAGRISTILNPPPEMETVEVEGWAVLDKDGRNVGLCYYENDPLPLNGVKKVKLTGSYTRPVPRPVERSVSVGVTVSQGGHNVRDNGGAVWGAYPEVCGKRGTLTFTWTETPKGE